MPTNTCPVAYTKRKKNILSPVSLSLSLPQTYTTREVYKNTCDDRARIYRFRYYEDPIDPRPAATRFCPTNPENCTYWHTPSGVALNGSRSRGDRGAQKSIRDYNINTILCRRYWPGFLCVSDVFLH